MATGASAVSDQNWEGVKAKGGLTICNQLRIQRIKVLNKTSRLV